LAGFGLGAAQADMPAKDLSGGQKARLSLLLATLDKPHLLILDEPTNHLDIESREALVEALTAYTGAVILVSHDMHLLSLVADRLWLVSDGTVTRFDDDLEAYRTLLLKKNATPKKQNSKPQTPKIDLKALQSDLRKAEARIEKLEVMHSKLQDRLADPDLYDEARATDLKIWQDKYAEWEDAMEKAETLWMAAQERLDRAQS
jgi:ATP-binding cassette subfamily F protein 3